MNKIAMELTIISARLKKNANIFTRMRAYTVVTLIGHDDDPILTTRTPADKHHRENPVWGTTMKLLLEEHELHGNRTTMLLFQVRCKRTLHDKNLGWVYVPVKELFETYAVEHKRRWTNSAFLATSRSGKAKAILYVAYRFGEGVRAHEKADNVLVNVVEPSAPPLPAGDSTRFMAREEYCFMAKPIPSAPYLEDDTYDDAEE